MMPPRNVREEPGIAVMRPPTRPPVTDSATPSDQPRCSRRLRTTDSMVSVLTPKTRSPTMSRTLCSHVDSKASASCWVFDFAVRRTLMPSQPLARNASVGLPSVSSSEMIGSSFSFSDDSLSPQVRRTRLEMTEASPLRDNKSGNTARANMSCIS